MTDKNRQQVGPSGGRHSHHADEWHVMDYVRVVYKRRWISIPVFVALFALGSVNALRETPMYEAHTQVLIDTDRPKVARLDTMFEADGGYDEEFFATQFRILQSRSLARRAVDNMTLWDAPKLGNGPDPTSPISPVDMAMNGVRWVFGAATSMFRQDPARPSATATADTSTPTGVGGETAAQTSRIDEFLSGVAIVPVRGSRIVEIRYASTDPIFAAQAANGLANAYIQQSMEFRFDASKQAADFLGGQLATQRKAVESSEAALQAFKEKNGAVSVDDNASNIVVARLTELNTALTKAKTERINKESVYNQLKAAESNGSLDTFPEVMSNQYVQRLRGELSDLQRQQVQLAERYGERHAEMVKNRAAIESAEAKLAAERSKVVESVRNEYMAAQAEERSLQSALNAQKGEALSMNRTGIEYSVLQREVESNREVYQSLLQQTKETGITGENRVSNIRVVDQAVPPGGPVSPNIPRALMMSMFMSLVVAVGLAFGVEHLDNRIATPQEMKTLLSIPFLGMVPATPRDQGNPLIIGDAPANFVEAIKTIRTSVLFSSAEEGLRTVVVTSAAPGEGKSIVATNLAMALAQAGQRVALIDADMRRPRVHEIFDAPGEPGLSNVLTGNAKTAESIRKTGVPGLWLLTAGHIPPNPAELLGSRRWLEFVASLEDHFDWAIIDTPPVLAVSDASVVANRSTGVVFVVNSDKTSRQSARQAIEQLDGANAHVIGSVLNRVDIIKHPYYYASYYRKDYARYYSKPS